MLCSPISINRNNIEEKLIILILISSTVVSEEYEYIR